MKLFHYEIGACRSVDQIHAMSTADAEVLARYMPDGTARIRVVPNSVDTEHFRPPNDLRRKRSVLIVGNFENLPNLDGFQFFVDDVWPLVRSSEPELELFIIGAKTTEAMHRLDGRDGIHVVGEVAEMREAYHAHAVLVIPIRAGSGTRLKLLEAFAAGIPVVSTTIGAEGIDCSPGRELIIADQPDEIAAGIQRVLTDPANAAEMVSRARDLAIQSYDWARAADANLRGIDDLLSARSARVRPSVACQIANSGPK